MKCEQIIYTRCSPVFSFKSKSYKSEEGLGIYNLSEGLLSFMTNEEEQRVRYFLESYYDDPDSEQAWMYFSISGKDVMLTSVKRKYDPSKRRKNGQSHRPGNFISQAVIGKFDVYPCDMATNAVFKCAELDENECYRLDYADFDSKRLPALDFKSIGFDPSVKKSSDRMLSAILSFLCSSQFGSKILLVEADQSDFMNAIVEAMHLFPEQIARSVHFSTSSSKLGEQCKLFGSMSSKPIFDIVRGAKLPDGLKAEDFIICDKNSKPLALNVAEESFVKHAVGRTPLFMEFRKWLVSKTEAFLSNIAGLPGVIKCFEFYKHVFADIAADDYSILIGICDTRDEFFKNCPTEINKASDFLFRSYGEFASSDMQSGWRIFNDLVKDRDFVRKLSASCKTDASVFEIVYGYLDDVPVDEPVLDELIRWSESVYGDRKTESVVGLRMRRSKISLNKACSAVDVVRILDDVAGYFSDSGVVSNCNPASLFDTDTICKLEGMANASVDVSFVNAASILKGNSEFNSIAGLYVERIASKKGWFVRLNAMYASTRDASAKNNLSELVEKLLSKGTQSSVSKNSSREAKPEPNSGNKPKSSFFSSIFGGKKGR